MGFMNEKNKMTPGDISHHKKGKRIKRKDLRRIREEIIVQHQRK